MRARSFLTVALGAGLWACSGPLPSAPSVDASAVDASAVDAPASDAANQVPGPPTGMAVAADYEVSTLAGEGMRGLVDGTGTAAQFGEPGGVAVDAAGNVYVADKGNHTIRKVTSVGVVTTLAGTGQWYPFTDGPGASATFTSPGGVAVDAAGTVYVADSSNNRIRKVTPAGVVTTLAGAAGGGWVDGTGAVARFDNPTGVGVDASGNLYVSDLFSHRIRKVTPAGVVTTLAGSGTPAFAEGTGAAASFDQPWGLAVDPSGNVYVSDHQNHRIRKVTPAGVVTTLAGSGAPAFADGSGATACFNYPGGLALDTAGNLYVADMQNKRIRKVTPAGAVTTLAGSGYDPGPVVNGPASLASFFVPDGVAVDAAGNVYVGDFRGVRKITKIGPGQLVVSWVAPAFTGSSPITGYTASASSPGYPLRTCTTTGATSCTLTGLTSGAPYVVSVTATNAVGTSVPSVEITAVPN